MKRKKRAKKSIESLKKTIEEHEHKLENAREDGKTELVAYYEKELEMLKSYLKRKEGIAKR